MPKVNVFDMSGAKKGTITLKDSVFGIEVNETAMHSVVVAQLSNARQGTQSAKTRSEVRGGGKRPWRQKGTGRARHGSTRNVQWTGGGVAFAPKPRSYNKAVPKKLKRLALKSALTTKVNEKELVVLDVLEMETYKTKEFATLLTSLKLSNTSVLIILDTNDAIVIKSANNLSKIKTTQVNSLNVYDLIKYEKVIITKAAVKMVEEVYA